jgi:hypothetical protein
MAGSQADTQGLGAVRDPLVATAAAWIEERERLEVMIRKWKQLETRLFRRARGLGIAIDAARSRRCPEVQAMRRLDRKMETIYAVLANLEREAAAMRPLSAEGALAKIELGMRVQGRFNWQDHAWELTEDGIAALRALATRKG